MTVSNPDKVIFPEPGYTKRDLVGHYEAVAEAMLPHVAGRPLTLHRFPDGVDSPGFMQKNASKHFPEFIGRIELPKQGGTTIYPTVDSEEGIVYLANQGTVTFHTWMSRIPHVDRPDKLVLDIDPAEGDVTAARFGASAVRDILESLDLESAVMATGSEGYHVVVMINPDHESDEIGYLGRAVAELASRTHPDVLTTEFSIEKRGGRAFVDWLRNRQGQTGVSAWSLRPRPRATVAVPIGWDELESIAPDEWDLRTVPPRLHIDPVIGLAAQDAGQAIESVASHLEEMGIELGTFDRFRS